MTKHSVEKIEPEESDPEGKAKWAPGENADGGISIHTPEEALKLIGERDADEEAFAKLLPEDDGGEQFEEDLDDVSDLDEDVEAV